MRGEGIRYADALTETVLGTTKSELISQTTFQSHRLAENAIAKHIGGFYNPIR